MGLAVVFNNPVTARGGWGQARAQSPRQWELGEGRSGGAGAVGGGAAFRGQHVIRASWRDVPSWGSGTPAHKWFGLLCQGQGLQERNVFPGSVEDILGNLKFKKKIEKI